MYQAKTIDFDGGSHASFSPALVSTINFLVPVPSDSERASAVARFLDDVAAAVLSEGSSSHERSPLSMIEAASILQALMHMSCLFPTPHPTPTQ